MSDPAVDAAIRQTLAESRAIATITIRFNVGTGEYAVLGPMDNPIIFLGMLEFAKSHLEQFLRRRVEQRILTPKSDNGG